MGAGKQTYSRHFGGRLHIRNLPLLVEALIEGFSFNGGNIVGGFGFNRGDVDFFGLGGFLGAAFRKLTALTGKISYRRVERPELGDLGGDGGTDRLSGAPDEVEDGA